MSIALLFHLPIRVDYKNMFLELYGATVVDRTLDHSALDHPRARIFFHLLICYFSARNMLVMMIYITHYRVDKTEDEFA